MTGPLYLVSGSLLTFAAYASILAEKVGPGPFFIFLMGMLTLAVAMALDQNK